MNPFDNVFVMWLVAAIITLVGAFATYALAWVVVTLVAAISAAGTVAWVALSGALFVVSVVLTVHLCN